MPSTGFRLLQKRKLRRGCRNALVSAVFLVVIAACSQGESGSSDGGLLAGETIEWSVPFGEGGGFDAQSRVLAPFLAEELGARVRVVNEPGAGGLIATNKTWSANPDGLRVQIALLSGTLGAELADAEGVLYESERFSWIGRITSDPDAIWTASDNSLASFDEVIGNAGFTWLAVGAGSNTYVNALAMQAAFGAGADDIVVGFSGTGDSVAALLRGDGDLYSGSMWTSLPGFYNEYTPLAVIFPERHEELPDVPSVLEFEPTSDEGAEILDAHLSLALSGRALIGPPDMDPEILEELREAFQRVLENPEAIEAVRKIGEDVNEPLSGEETEGLAKSILNETPDVFIEILKQAF